MGDGPDRNRGGDVVVTDHEGGGKEGDEGYNKRAAEGSANWHLCRVWHNGAWNRRSKKLEGSSADFSILVTRTVVLNFVLS